MNKRILKMILTIISIILFIVALPISVGAIQYNDDYSSYSSTSASGHLYIQPCLGHGNQFHYEMTVRAKYTPVLNPTTTAYKTKYFESTDPWISCGLTRTLDMDNDNFKVIEGKHICWVKCAYENCPSIISNSSYH